MSTPEKKTQITRRSLADVAKDYKASSDLKARKAASIKSAKKHTAKDAWKSADKEETRFVKIDEKTVPVVSDEEEPKKIKWALIIPAMVILFCLGIFVTASYAGWIQSFLTPPDKQVKVETTTPEPQTTTERETTTKEPETTTTEETTEETTTEYVPSYYIIDVNLAYNIVTVYVRGEKLNDGYDPEDPKDDVYDRTPVIAFTCSPGVNGATPTGTFYLEDRSDWCFMVGDVYTQYATRIHDDVMFHSIPYYTKDPGDIETYEYNILGYEASSACVRLNVRDASWIFYNCAIDTEVNIFYDWNTMGPLTPEPIYKIPTDIPQLAGWDPTDVYSYGNPWLTYSASLTSASVTLPSYSSVNSLISAFGPTDEYGNNLSDYFYTDGGYSLYYPGTYETVAHIDVGNLAFSFPVTITITGDISDDYYSTYVADDYGYDYSADDNSYDTGGYYDEYGNYYSYENNYDAGGYDYDNDYDAYGYDYGYENGGNDYGYEDNDLSAYNWEEETAGYAEEDYGW